MPLIPEKIIEEALKNGFKPSMPCEIDGIEVFHAGDTILDPLFWQALCKAWKFDQRIWKCPYYNPLANEPGEKGCASTFCEHAGWKDIPRYAISFFELLMSSPTQEQVDSFWQELNGNDRVATD